MKWISHELPVLNLDRQVQPRLQVDPTIMQNDNMFSQRSDDVWSEAQGSYEGPAQATRDKAFAVSLCLSCPRVPSYQEVDFLKA
jgi:hypothetical protein